MKISYIFWVRRLSEPPPSSIYFLELYLVAHSETAVSGCVCVPEHCMTVNDVPSLHRSFLFSSFLCILAFGFFLSLLIYLSDYTINLFTCCSFVKILKSGVFNNCK